MNAGTALGRGCVINRRSPLLPWYIWLYIIFGGFLLFAAAADLP